MSVDHSAPTDPLWPAPDQDLAAQTPPQIGRYRAERILGNGGFGTVWLARDEQLQRLVAVKVPHSRLIAFPEDAQPYLTEALIVASLDHPNIVPVYDVGATRDFPCFVVSKFVDGSTLAKGIHGGQIAAGHAAELIATVAEALQYAHCNGVVHRDVKPGNILLDTGNKPYVADFGLALKEADIGRGSRYVGTPAYMSPEQARGEGHRVDGRSDIFSLGIVFYELLTQRRPFHAASRDALLEQIASQEARPPRQWDDAIPKELERICLKALAKRASDRYATARDLADDLRHFLAVGAPALEAPSPATAQPPAQPSAPALVTPPTSAAPPGGVVPKGLRSFDAADTDFFLQLLPGPRDRHGIPESLRSWKQRIEQLDADDTFAVGLVYGPSGCGKSSFIKAGLLPRLARHVTAVYVDATAGETETRLVKGLRKRCPGLDTDLGLAAALAGVRRGLGLPAGEKLLIILDQFEQWLHAHDAQENTDLVAALRQIDGARVQCLILVRDDFWMAATRLLRELEVRLVEGKNAAAVDLFDLRHAKKVLALFGRAYGALPEKTADSSAEQDRFVEQACQDLAQEGKVSPVRLAVFAEMVKGREWTPATLKTLGGMEGIGVTFLEEAFSSVAAPPAHRIHQVAARAILKSLLPEQGTEIRGNLRPYAELVQACGYTSRPRDFDELLGILDRELRLVSPSTLEGADSESGKRTPASDGKFYQLTHDYLVPALRAWLTRKQRETWRGRAEIQLKERAAEWARRRERRLLPSLPALLNMSFGVSRWKRQPVEKDYLRAAVRLHAVVWGIVLAAMLILGRGVWTYVMTERAHSLVEGLLLAPSSSVPAAMDRLATLGDRPVPVLRAKFETASDPQQKLRAALGLTVCGDGERVEDFLVESAARAPASEGRNLISALKRGWNERLSGQLLERMEREKQANTKARYAITLLHSGSNAHALEILGLRADPAYRTAFIHVYGTWHGELRDLFPLFERCNVPGVRSGLCAAIGQVDPNELGEDERESVREMLLSHYRNATEDGGTHSAAGWALQRWKIPLPELEALSEPDRGTGWHINSLSMTMLRIEPGRFQMGESAAQARPVQVTRALYVCDREVSLGAFRQFLRDDKYRGVKPAGRYPDWADPAFEDKDAAGSVSWSDAVLFCNWLSLRERRQTCYKRMPGPGKGAGAWRCDFNADGYRLPTSAEWEYVCRAGTSTAYSFGNKPDQILQYGWVYLNSNGHAWPGGLKLPNAWGLFDTHGNVDEWCWDWSSRAPPGKEALQDPTGPESGTMRVLRGGDFLTNRLEAAQCGCQDISAEPEGRSRHIGFRVVYSVVGSALRGGTPKSPIPPGAHRDAPRVR